MQFNNDNAYSSSGTAPPQDSVFQDPSGGYGSSWFNFPDVQLEASPAARGAILFLVLAAFVAVCIAGETAAQLRGDAKKTLGFCALEASQMVLIIGSGVLGAFLCGDKGMQPYAYGLIIGEFVCLELLVVMPFLILCKAPQKVAKKVFKHLKHGFLFCLKCVKHGWSSCLSCLSRPQGAGVPADQAVASQGTPYVSSSTDSGHLPSSFGSQWSSQSYNRPTSRGSSQRGLISDRRRIGLDEQIGSSGSQLARPESHHMENMSRDRVGELA